MLFKEDAAGKGKVAAKTNIKNLIPLDSISIGEKVYKNLFYMQNKLSFVEGLCPTFSLKASANEHPSRFACVTVE
ncbi:MAG: hypothetical protein LBB16_00955 [Puniceicoccales bacterium]|jgi:hypothetical protein|nr:hypothetical protein [Puniceicoccales bacterium]